MVLIMKKALLVVALLVAGCSSGEEADGPDTTIVVSHAILGAVVNAAVPSDVSVEVLIPNGTEVHDFEPSAKDIEKLNNASLLVVNGFGLEEGLEAAIEARIDNGGAVFVAADHIVLPANGLVPADDPHFFTSPEQMEQLLPELLSAIDALSPDWTANEDEAQSLVNEAMEVANKAGLSGKKVITGHEFLGYFCALTGCEVVGSVIDSLSTEAGPSAQHLAELNALIESDPSIVVVVEVGEAAEALEFLVSADASAVRELPIESLPDSGSYVDYVAGIVTALTGS
jgi:zinc/manganese transport system substrate-binding protein